MTTIVIGLDPGQYGALVALREEEFLPFPMPLTKNSTIDCTRIYDFLYQFRGEKVDLCIEKVHSMPGQGVSSTFKFGMNTGSAWGALVASAYGLGILGDIEWVTPQAWKKQFNLIKQPKDAAIERMYELLGEKVELDVNKKCLQGIADAYLIARHYLSQRN